MMSSTSAMTDAMKNASKVMTRMSKSLKLPQMQKIARDFSMQSELMGQTEEMMGDTLDGMMDDDEEEETDAIVAQVMTELSVSIGGAATAPIGVTGAAATPALPAAPVAMAMGGGGGGGGGLPPPPPSGGMGGGGGGGLPPPPPSGGFGGGGGGGGGLPPLPPSGGLGGGAAAPPPPAGGGAPGSTLSELEARLNNLRG